MKSLTDLLISNNKVKNIGPLAGLPLTWLDLSGNLVTDLAPLKNMESLSNLYLQNNQIKDISPLLTLTYLTEVDLSGNPLNQAAAAVVE